LPRNPTREFDSGSWIGSCWSVKDQIATIDDLQDTIESYAETVSDREAAKALGDVADALGRLEVAIDAAGPNYRYDPVVKLASKTVSYAGLTAALKLVCTP